MDILFKNPPASGMNSNFMFSGLTVSQCYIKTLILTRDRARVMKKPHHHTGFEVHILTSGSQDYKIGESFVRVSAGEMLIVFPFRRHMALSASADAKKRAVSFTIAEDTIDRTVFEKEYLITKTPAALDGCLSAIEAERAGAAPLTESLVYLLSLECILHILRSVGYKNEVRIEESEDARVTLAKQYIKDNIRRAVSLGELASYLCISEKQLSRIFKKGEGISVADYVHQKRCEYIEELLVDRNLSLRRISEELCFSSEYYFNAFFKKHAGMSPGAYRRTLTETD